MPTDQQNNNPAPPATPAPATQSAPQQPAQSVTQLVTEMQKVDTSAPDAKSNATSDGQGGRIEFNEQPQQGTLIGSTSIKK